MFIQRLFSSFTAETASRSDPALANQASSSLQIAETPWDGLDRTDNFPQA